ncbi:MAG: EscU/YscU/HrcU family type III secretion system export apparatus switch protein [Terracidiphilus sp.]
MPGDRTEQASPHRREKASKDGDILHSRELATAAGTLAGVLSLGFLGGRILDSFRTSFSAALDLGAPDRWEDSTVQPTMLAMRRIVAHSLIPVGIAVSAIVAAALFVGVIQTGGLQIHVGSIGFRLDRVNPASNLKNLFSLRAVSRLGKSLLPASLLAVFAVQRIARELTIPPFSIARLSGLASDIYGLLAAASWLLLGWALVDYAVEWRSRESRLMMSREEMKQEFKETEGSPQTRGRIRSLQRQMRRRKVKADVSKAAVVLTNPTHYAVALGFDFVTMDAPRVLAKGRNLLAEEIKTEARWAGVPIIENPPLARSLYRSVEAGHSIPVDLYEAVAAILAYLYRQRVEAEMRERRARQGGSQAKAAAANLMQRMPASIPVRDRRSDINTSSADRPPDGGLR